MFISSTRFSRTATAVGAAVLLLLAQAQTTLACRCSEPTDTITTHFMDVSDFVGRFYVNNNITPIAGADGSLYYMATVYKWFKGDIGLGKLIVKTSASSSECGAVVTVRNFSILFGTVTKEVVPGYAGTVSTLTIDSCKPQKVVTAVSKAEWTTLTSYNNSTGKLVCAATACDGMKQPVPGFMTCPTGTEYATAAVCQGQDNGSCGWTVKASCNKLPVPDICVEQNCDGLAKPSLSCPAGTLVDTSTFTCEKQTSGSCGWTGKAVCKPVDLKVATKVNAISDVVCVESDCNGMAKPFLRPLACPRTTMYAATFTCVKQTTTGTCGWSASAECKAGLTKTDGAFVVCDVRDCDALDKPKIDPLPCPDGESFVEISTCEEQQEPGKCGWKVGGQCQIRK